jgi:hypothetical protein
LNRIFVGNCLKKFIIQKEENLKNIKFLDYFIKIKNDFSDNRKFEFINLKKNISGNELLNKKINNKFEI